MPSRYIVTNFAYGTGPFLRTTQLALAFNDELERRGKERYGIIIPLVYGERQRQVMLEEFAADDAKHPGEILIDAALGGILSPMLFGKESYESYIARWSSGVRDSSARAHAYLSGKLDLETLRGEKRRVDGKKIVLELNRSPRIRYDVAPAYFTSFAYLQDILEHARQAPRQEVDVSPEILARALKEAEWVESAQDIHCIPYPGTFSYEHAYAPRYKDEVITPPLGPLFHLVRQTVEKGMYVTVTGIPGLERLYGEAKRLGLRLYSNDIRAVPESTHVLPHIISDENIVFHFARSGWSSVWLSIDTQVPLIVPPFDPHDDPEIYFNNKAVEALGVGIVWRGESLTDLLEKRDAIASSQREVRDGVEKRFGNWDGIGVCAKLFVEKHLGL